MNTERLLRIAEIVEAVPPQDFNMDRWAPNDCGTACCAIGWAARQPDIIEQGLRIENDGPVYGERFDYDAVAKFLDCSYGDASALFSPMSYEPNVKPRYVAKCIRHIAKGGEYISGWRRWGNLVSAD